MNIAVTAVAVLAPVLATLTGTPITAAPTIKPGVAQLNEVRVVNARWFVPLEGSRAMMYSVRARRTQNASTGEISSRFRLARLLCRIDESDSSTNCSSAFGKARLSRGRPQRLNIAEDLSAAKLVVTDRYGTTRVTWSATGTSRLYVHDESCPSGNGGGVGLFQPTMSSGTVWRSRFPPNNNERDSSSLTRFVLSSTC